MVSAASLFVSALRGCSAQGKSRTVVPQGTGARLAIRPVFQGQHYKRVPQAGGQLQVVHCQQAPLVRFHQVRTDPLLWEDFDLPHFQSSRVYSRGRNSPESTVPQLPVPCSCSAGYGCRGPV